MGHPHASAPGSELGRRRTVTVVLPNTIVIDKLDVVELVPLLNVIPTIVSDTAGTEAVALGDSFWKIVGKFSDDLYPLFFVLGKFNL